MKLEMKSGGGRKVVDSRQRGPEMKMSDDRKFLFEEKEYEIGGHQQKSEAVGKEYRVEEDQRCKKEQDQ